MKTKPKHISNHISPILANLNVAVFRTENRADGGFIDVNPAFLTIFGYSSLSELNDKKASDLYARASDREMMRQRLITNGAVQSEEYLFKRSSGETFPGRVSSVVVENQTSGASYFDGVVEDVSELRDMMSELDTKRQQLENEQRVFHRGPVMMIQWPVNGHDPLKYISANVKDILGYEVSDFIDGNILYPDIVHAEDRAEVEEQVKQCLDSSVETMHVKPYRLKKHDGSYLWIQDYGFIHRNDEGIAMDIVGYIYDVTDTHESQSRLRDSELRYRSLIENSPTGILRIDLDGAILDVNPQMVQMLGSPSAEATKKFNIFTFPPLQKAGISKRFQEALEKQKSIKFEGKYGTAWGKEIYYQAVVNPVFDGHNQVIGAQANMEDVTETEQALEEKRVIQREQLEERNIFVAAPIMIFRWKASGHDPLDNVTENVKDILGYTRNDLKQGNPLYTDIIHPDDVIRVRTLSAEMMEQGTYQFTTPPYRIKRKDGVYIWVNDHSTIMRDEQGGVKNVIGIVYDISDSIEAEETLKATETTYREIFNANNEAMFLHDAETYAILDVNETMLEKYECTYEQALGSNIGDLSYGECTQEIAEHYLEKARTEGPQSFEWHSQTLTGKIFWAEINLRLAMIHGKAHFLVTSRNVTERREMEEALRAAVHEQEVLTREVHHRVKNNMQVINSILNLQAEYTKDPVLTEILKESQNRVRSMALIHEKLFKSKSMAEVEFDNYLKSLIREVINFYSEYAAKIKFIESIDPMYMEITKAIPSGLIINELITNSLKYAFPDNREGTIWVTLSSPKSGFAKIEVRDDGLGLPPELDFETTQTMGLRIVRILTEQLNGKMDIDTAAGTSFTLTFELESSP